MLVSRRLTSADTKKGLYKDIDYQTYLHMSVFDEKLRSIDFRRMDKI